MNKVTISLTQKELLQVSQIMVDRDAQEALTFIRNCLEPKIRMSQSFHCRPWTDEEEKPY